MSRLRFSEIPNTAVLTPPAGKATVFLDSADNVLKAKLDDGSLIILSVTQEYLDDLVSNLLQDSVTIDFTYDDVGNKITGEVIQSALNISLIPNTPSGNLTATDVQSALNELQSDVDTRALQSSLTAHENLTSGVHGVTGSVVGTTDTQTLTNKTIDADDNTIIDLEVDNLKVGVLNTSITLTGASNTQIPSALAVKTYVDNVAIAQNEASEISYDNSVSGLVATNVQDAIDEVELRVGTVETGLANHLSDTVDAHDASAISNIPLGNLIATDVQSALNELQAEIDTVSSGSVEVAQDAVGNILTDSANIDFTYDDVTPYITADLTDTTVTAGSYGSATQVSSVVVDAKGRITSASDVTIAIPSTQITDFTEAVQDAVGTSLADSSSVDLTYSDVSNTISASVLPAGVNHNALQNYVSNEHIDHSTVSINPGTGLSGGGDITASRTLNIANTAVTAGSYGSASEVATYTVNAQGQLTASSDVSIQIDENQVTNLVSDLAGKQPLDSTLTALSAYNTNGLVTQTSPDTFVGRTIVAGVGISVSNGDGIAGNPTIASTITQYTDEQAQDASALMLTSATHDGVSVSYNDAGNSLSITNTDKGSVAVTSHEAAIDPHPQYTTTAEASAAAPVQSVNSQTGNVVLTTTNITEGSNLYFTDERAQDAIGNIFTDSASVDFTYNDAGNTVFATVLPAGVDHDLLQNYVVNEHVDHSTVIINAGTGLSGGGDITTSRTLNIANTTVTAGSYGSATQVSTLTVNARGQLTTASNTTIAIPSTQVTDFNEAVQDAVGNILTDSTTIDFTYNDGANTISAVVVDGSISDVKIATGVNATKIGAGTVDNTEFGYLNGVTSDIQTQLNNKQPLDSTLTSLAAYNTNGILVQTAADTFTGRTVTGTASNISVTNGNGVAGNPTLDLVNAGTAGTYGSASSVPVITTDVKGRVTNVTDTTITGVPAANIVNTPAGNIGATNVQSALNELDVEKAKLAGGNALTGDQSVTTGSVAVGTVTQDASSILTLASTTQGMLMPRMTSAQRRAIASPAEGLLVFDTDLNTSCEYSGAAWKFEYKLNATAIQTSTSTTYANITEFTTLSLDAGLYVLELKGIMQSTATGTGVGLRLVNATATISTIVLNWTFSQGGAGTDKNFEYNQLTTADNTTSNSAAPANANFPVFGNGVFRVTTAGTVAIQIRTEINASGVSIRPDSSLMIKKVG